MLNSIKSLKNKNQSPSSLPEIRIRRNTFPYIPGGKHHTEIKVNEKDYRKEKYRPTVLVNIDAKILSKTLSNLVLQPIDWLKYVTQWDYSQECEGDLT